VGRALTLAGVAYATDRPWTDKALKTRLAEARRFRAQQRSQDVATITPDLAMQLAARVADLLAGMPRAATDVVAMDTRPLVRRLAETETPSPRLGAAVKRDGPDLPGAEIGAAASAQASSGNPYATLDARRRKEADRRAQRRAQMQEDDFEDLFAAPCTD
jgi:hypothetical protein